MGIDILVPVLSRPQNVIPFMESVRVTKEAYAVFFICTPRDEAQIEACEASGGTVLLHPEPARKGDFAKKINWAFEQTGSEWLFQGADDIRFSEGWDSQALMLARKTGKQVIGTNDLHNPSVLRRLSSTHTLFSRSYIQEYGGTTDNSGKVFCELYDHQFVDTEFCETARARDQWAFCRTAIVEHLHPHWGLAENDPTYEKAMRNTNQDYRLYIQRMGYRARTLRSERMQQRFEERQRRRAAR